MKFKIGDLVVWTFSSGAQTSGKIIEVNEGSDYKPYLLETKDGWRYYVDKNDIHIDIIQIRNNKIDDILNEDF